MSTQWHPVFVRLLGELIKDYYEIETEVPISDLPRRADVLVIHRHPDQQPHFQGLWSHLTDWNVLEFKGPTDDAEPDDLEKLMAVGTGLTYRLNEQRRSRSESGLGNDQVSFWYLAPTLGETFLEQARLRVMLDYETGGLWRGRSWGHPVWLLAYRDAVVETDTVPLRLLDREPGAPAALGELVLGNEELWQRFAQWFRVLQPQLWKEMRQMGSSSKRGSIIDWEAVGENEDLGEVVRILPPERVIEILGVERAIQTIGLNRVLEAVGLPKVIEAMGPEKVMEELLAHLSPEQIQEIIRKRQQQ